MQRTELSPEITRIVLTPADDVPFHPISFQDQAGEYLTQTGCVFTPRQVWRLSGNNEVRSVRQTANGEAVSFDTESRTPAGECWSAVLRFSFPGSPVLTGLGAHEDGIFDYAGKSEWLYQHNMKIPIPFLLCSDGWGLLVEAGCAMKYRGDGHSFTLELDAVNQVSYILFRGQNCADILRMLSSFAGLPVLPPRWVFGYIQSKERYQSAAELVSVSREFRKRGLGLDCIVQDWMTWQDGCWGDKTPDPDRFPDIVQLTEELHNLNVHLMVSVWPNADCGRDCDEFEEGGHFLPASRIYNAFSPEARDLYWQQCRRFWMEGGADALWCDSCEPITDPDWCGSEKRDPETRYHLIVEASSLRMDPVNMNLYSSYHLHGLQEHWLRDYPDKRPVFLSRSGGLDSGALGAVLWSGDISARWDVLSKQVTEAIRVSCSGIPWWTVDIGGFFVSRKDLWFWKGDYPEGVRDPAYRELYVRWFQFGSMLPVFRSHGTDTPREPWAFGDGAPEYAAIEDILRLRYRLLPWLYATAAQTCKDGLPMIRAMMVAFPGDPDLFRLDDQYMLGDALLVKPVTQPLEACGGETEIVLPAGCGWYNLFTNAYTKGGNRIHVPVPLNQFPLFVRAGSILPVAGHAESTADLPSPAREILVYGGADASFCLYDDAGDGMGHLQGVFLRIPLRYTEQDRVLELGPAEGSMPVNCMITVRFFRPDGSAGMETVHYTGTRCFVRDTGV